MKKIKLIFLLLLLTAPALSLAHGDDNKFNENWGRFEMMRYMEDQVLDKETHEEMESLMDKMMGGQLTKDEADKLSSLANGRPGQYSMMLNRFTGMNPGYFGVMGMMGWASPWWQLIFFVWLAVGILLAIFLLKKILKS